MKRTAVEDALGGWRTRKESKARVSPTNFESWWTWRGMKAAVGVRRAQGWAKKKNSRPRGGHTITVAK